jgi:hypothetical protein
LTLNGSQVVDEEHFFRAPSAMFYPRGARSTVLGFTTHYAFASDRLAQAFFLTHPGDVPTGGLLQVVVGTGADVQTLYLPGTVVESVAPQLIGCHVRVSYVLKGGMFRVTDPRLDPSYVDPAVTGGGGGAAAPSVATVQKGLVVFQTGIRSVEILFATVFDAPPLITVTTDRLILSLPVQLVASVRAGSITKAGFVVELSGAPPDSTYTASYVATRDPAVAPLQPPTVSRRGSVPVRTGDSSVVITFSEPFAQVPQVFLAVQNLGLNSTILTASVRAGSLTASGCIVDLSAPPPDWTYRVAYTATVP